MLYQDFDLLIERTGRGYRAQVLNSPGGQATSEFRLPFSEDKLENFLLRLGRTRRLVRRVESPEMNTAKTFGASLFNAVFNGDVRACFRSSLDEAKRQGTGLRVRLRLAAPEIADLPWEFLYNSSLNRFIALSVQTPLVRYMDLPERIQPIPVTPPIRALVMISSPTDYPSLDVEAEWGRLNDSLGDLCKSGHIAIDRLDDASLGALQRKLRKSQYHIFHFIGHGEFDQEAQEGVLILEGENERGHRVSSQYLGMLLHDHESLRVAILNACEGARSSRTDPFAGSAQSLVQQGIPAVIAMQFEIADDVASTFAHEFYGALADGYPIDAALTEARKAIFAGGREVEWGTPVLYLRAPDGRIFDVERTADSRPLPAFESSGSQRLDSRSREELERDEQERIVAAAIVEARGQFAAGHRADALTSLRRFSSSHQIAAQTLRELLIEDERLTALELRAIHEREERERQQRERETAEAAARAEQERRELDGHVTAAADLFERGDLAAAWARVCDALQIDSSHHGAMALEARIRQALDEQTAQAEARELERKLRDEAERARAAERDAALATARATIERLLAAGDHEQAQRALADAETRLHPGATYADLRVRLADLRREVKARQDKAAEDVVARARREFASAPATAIELLERSASHPLVSAVCRELKQMAADEAARLEREAAERDRQAAERRRQQEQRARDLNDALERITEYLSRSQLAEAAGAIDVASATFGDSDQLEELRERWRQVQRRVARNQAVRAAIADATRLAAAGDFDAALKALEACGTHPEAEAALTALRARADETARRRDIERRIAEVIARAQQERSHSIALASLEQALPLDPDHVELRRAIRERRRRATLFSLVQPRALRRIAAVLVLAVGVAALIGIYTGWLVMPLPGSRRNAAGPPPSINAPAPATVPSVVSTTPAPSKPAEPPPVDPAKPPDDSAKSPVDSEIERFSRLARQFLLRGQRERALSSAQQGLALDRTNAELLALLKRIVDDSRADAAAQRQAAVDRRATAAPSFDRGNKSMTRGDQLLHDGQDDTAVRSFWDAAKFFKDAAPPAAPSVPVAETPPARNPDPPAPKPSGAEGTARPNTGTVDPGKTSPSTAAAAPAAANPATEPKPSPPKARPPRATIDEALDAYARALTTNDREGLLAVYPSAPRAVTDNLGSLPKGIRSYSVTIIDRKVRSENETRAEVDCTVFHNYIKFSGSPDTRPVSYRVALERVSGSWVVRELRRR